MTLAALEILLDDFKECPGTVHPVGWNVLVNVMQQFFWFPGRKLESTIFFGPQCNARNPLPLKKDRGNDNIDFIPGNPDEFVDIAVREKLQALVADDDLAIFIKSLKGSCLRYKIRFMVNRLNHRKSHPFWLPVTALHGHSCLQQTPLI